MSRPLIHRLGLAGFAAVAAVAVATPRLLRLGATKEEACRSLPGDGEVPRAHVQGTRAITLDATPAEVWPWIAQIGYHGLGRAGWYALDFADNDGVESAWRIIPEIQHPAVGQMIGEEGLTIRAVEPNRLLLVSYHWPKTQWVRKKGLWPKFGHCSWVFMLEPVQGGRTRLIIRDRIRFAPFDLSVPFWPFFFIVDLLLQPMMLRGIRRRVEAATQQRVGISSPQSPTGTSRGTFAPSRVRPPWKRWRSDYRQVTTLGGLEDWGSR